MKGETTTMPTYEGLRLKVLEIRRKTFAAQRKKAIKDTNVKGGFELSFYGGLKMHDLGGLRINRC